MKHKFNPKLWTPVVTEHPQPTKRYRMHTRNQQPVWQPPSERYEVPGLIPKVPRKINTDDKPD